MRRTGAGLALKKENIGVLKPFEGISATQLCWPSEMLGEGYWGKRYLPKHGRKL